jgi:hypothetical protein
MGEECAPSHAAGMTRCFGVRAEPKSVLALIDNCSHGITRACKMETKNKDAIPPLPRGGGCLADIVGNS